MTFSVASGAPCLELVRTPGWQGVVSGHAAIAGRSS